MLTPQLAGCDRLRCDFRDHRANAGHAERAHGVGADQIRVAEHQRLILRLGSGGRRKQDVVADGKYGLQQVSGVVACEQRVFVAQLIIHPRQTLMLVFVIGEAELV